MPSQGVGHKSALHNPTSIAGMQSYISRSIAAFVVCAAGLILPQNYKDNHVGLQAHPADEIMKLCRAISKLSVPGAPNSLWKISYSPASLVSPRALRLLASGTTSRMPHSYAVGSTPYGARYRSSPAFWNASLSRPMTCRPMQLLSQEVVQLLQCKSLCLAYVRCIFNATAVKYICTMLWMPV